MGFFFGHHSPMPLCSLVVQASTTSIPFAELLPQSHLFRVFLYSQPQSSALIWSLNPTFQHPALVCSGGHASQAGWAGQGSGPRVWVSLSCCHTLVAMFSPTENEALLLSKLSSPTRGSPDVETTPHFHVPPGCRPLPLLFLFLLLSFVLPGSAGIFLVLLDSQGPLLVFSWAL